MLEASRGLRAAGCEVVIVTDGAGPAPLVTEAPVHCVPTLRLLRGARARALWAAVAPDLVVWNVGVSNGLYLRFERVPAPVIPVWTSPLYGLRDLLRLGPGVWMRGGLACATHVPGAAARHLLVRRLLGAPNVRTVIALSESTATALRALGVTSREVAVILPGIDEPWFAVRAIAPPAGAREVVFFGSADAVRGLQTLVQAVRLVRRRGLDLQATLYIRRPGPSGSGSLRPRAREVASAIRRVDGWLAPEELAARVSRAGIVALPFVLVVSDVPLAVLEAMATGRPVVSTRVDGIPDLLGGGRGYLVSPGDARGLACALERALGDPSDARRRGEAAASWAQDKTWDVMRARFAATVLAGP
jgi:glycosyltransferase involved in cell wall biosynthesis